jgi:hypothetical protein
MKRYAEDSLIRELTSIFKATRANEIAEPSGLVAKENRRGTTAQGEIHGKRHFLTTPC